MSGNTETSTIQEHIEVVQENLARAYVSAIMWSRIINSNPKEAANSIIVGILFVSLRDTLILSLSKVWDSGAKNRNSLSLPNLIGRTDIQISVPTRNKSNALLKSKFVTEIKFIRSRLVAHSLVPPNHIFADNDFIGSDYVEHLNDCAEILDEVMRKNIGQTFDVSSQDSVVRIWESVIEKL